MLNLLNIPEEQTLLKIAGDIECGPDQPDSNIQTSGRCPTESCEKNHS